MKSRTGKFKTALKSGKMEKAKRKMKGKKHLLLAARRRRRATHRRDDAAAA